MILMGDIIEDTYMANPEKHDHVLSIGFLNDLQSSGHLLDNYMAAFDIIISGDGPILPVNMMLDDILGASKTSSASSSVIQDHHLDKFEQIKHFKSILEMQK